MATKPRPRPPMMRVVRAAGAVTWRLRNDIEIPASVRETGVPTDSEQIEVLLVHRPRYHDWSWPKGKTEPGESLIACATREVEEETGMIVRLGAPMTTQRYRLGSGHTKEVHYWVGNVDLDASPRRARALAARAPLKEIDRVRWINVAKARKLLTRRGDRRLLDELVVRLECGTMVTRPVVLLRHAKAVSRKAWKGSEAQRPLARIGAAQVPALTGYLSAYGVHRVYTSPWRRCFSTVASYAALSGCELRTEPSLTETAVSADPQAASDFFADVLDHEAAPSAICVHRPSLIHLLRPLGVRCSASMTRLLPQEDPYLHTAEMLVAHIAVSSLEPSAVATLANNHNKKVSPRVDEATHRHVTPADLFARLAEAGLTQQPIAATVPATVQNGLDDIPIDDSEDNAELQEEEPQPVPQLHNGRFRQGTVVALEMHRVGING